MGALIINLIVLFLIGYWIYRAVTKKGRMREAEEETAKIEVAERAEREKEDKVEHEKQRERYEHFIGGDNILQHEIIKIHGGKGRGEEFLKSVVRRVEEANFPSKPICSTKTMFFDPARKQTQPFLVFENGTGEVRAWKMYVGAVDWGDLLDVSWYLMENIYEVPQTARPTTDGKFQRTAWESREVENFAGTIAAIVSSEAENLKNEIATGFSMK